MILWANNIPSHSFNFKHNSKKSYQLEKIITTTTTKKKLDDNDDDDNNNNIENNNRGSTRCCKNNKTIIIDYELLQAVLFPFICAWLTWIDLYTSAKNNAADDLDDNIINDFNIYQ